MSEDHFVIGIDSTIAILIIDFHLAFIEFGFHFRVLGISLGFLSSTDSGIFIAVYYVYRVIDKPFVTHQIFFGTIQFFDRVNVTRKREGCFPVPIFNSLR